MSSEIFREPAFWDVLGFFVFLYIVLFSWNLLKKNLKGVDRRQVILLLVLGVCGLVVDGIIIWNRFVI